MNRIAYCALSFIGFVFLVGCAHPHAESVALPALHTLRSDAWVRSPNGTFVMRVPEGWRLDAGPAGQSVQLISGTDPRAGLMIIRDFPTGEQVVGRALKYVRDGAREGLEAGIDGFVLESEQQLRLRGFRAFQIRYRGAMDGVAVHGSLTVMAGRDGLYSMNVMAPAGHFPGAERAAQEVLASLTAEPAAAATATNPSLETIPSSHPSLL